MNAATACRLKKEARALFPFWAVTAAWIGLPFLLSVRDPLPASLSGFLFGCCTFGPVAVGNEFTQGTMSFLLIQPVPRRQLWREKLMVTGTALLGLSFLLVVLIQFKGRPEELFTSPVWNDPVNLTLLVSLLVLIPIMGFCTGPALTLIARNALGGGALTFICPQMLLFLGMFVLHYAGIFNPANEKRLIMSYALVVGSVYSAGMFWFGRRQFAGLEDAAPIRREVALPDSWFGFFAGLAARLLPEKRGITTSLIRKELRLQQPAFAIAALLVTVWLAFLVVWVFRPTIGSGLMVVPPMLLCLGIPILLGGQSTAEERSLGIHDWHLTLPVTARRQWLVKVLVAISLNVMLGLLLPWLLAHGTQSLAKNSSEFLYGSDTKFFFIAISFALLSVALHASTVARNTSHALLGAIVSSVAVAFVCFTPNTLRSWLADWTNQYSITYPSYLDNYLYRIEMIYWLIGCPCLVHWFYENSLRNFRQSLGSLRLPFRRLLMIIAVVWVFVNIGFVQNYSWIVLYNLCSALFDLPGVPALY